MFKKKKIILLSFTFLGICCFFAPAQTPGADTIHTMPDQIINPLSLKTDLPAAKEKATVKIFPNPAKNKVEITISGFNPGYIKLQLMNSAGKLVREEKRLILNGNETIIYMFSETAGLYYLLLKQGVQMIRARLVIR